MSAQLVRLKTAAPVSQKSRVRIPYNPDFFFSGFLFADVKVASIERLRFTFTANGKRQTQVENFSEQKISR